jgi:hypothetical protein
MTTLLLSLHPLRCYTCQHWLHLDQLDASPLRQRSGR